MAPEGGSCSPRCLPTRATVVSIKARKSNLHWSTRLRTTLAGPGVHLQGRSLGSRPPNHESTHDPDEDIGLRSETIVAHDLAAGPTRQPSGKENKWNGTFPPWITNRSSKKVSSRSNTIALRHTLELMYGETALKPESWDGHA